MDGARVVQHCLGWSECTCDNVRMVVRVCARVRVFGLIC